MEVTELGIIVFLHPIISVLDSVSTIALQLLRESYLGLPVSTAMLSRLLQPENVHLSMEVTELGMVMLVRPLQSENILNIDNQ
jgi:hypothetical protein